MAVRTPRRAEILRTGKHLYRYEVVLHDSVPGNGRKTQHWTLRGAQRLAKNWVKPVDQPLETVEQYSEW